MGHTSSFAVFLLMLTIYFIIAVGTEIFIDETVQPRSMFVYLLATTLLTGIAGHRLTGGVRQLEP